MIRILARPRALALVLAAVAAPAVLPTTVQAMDLGKSRAEKNAEWDRYYEGMIAAPISKPRPSSPLPTRRFIYDTRSGEARYFIDETE